LYTSLEHVFQLFVIISLSKKIAALPRHPTPTPAKILKNQLLSLNLKQLRFPGLHIIQRPCDNTVSCTNRYQFAITDSSKFVQCREGKAPHAAM
jgi:hypothetical protein